MSMSLEQQTKEIQRFQDSVGSFAQLVSRMSNLRDLWTAADLANEITAEACTISGVAKQDIIDSNNLFDALIASAATYVNLISRLRKDLDYPAVR